MTSTVPSVSAGFDEALAAADSGAVTRDQARALIRARAGRELESLIGVAARLRDRLKGRRQLLEESLHPAHESLPRLLRLLHVSQRPWAGGRAHDDAG